MAVINLRGQYSHFNAMLSSSLSLSDIVIDGSFAKICLSVQGFGGWFTETGEI